MRYISHGKDIRIETLRREVKLAVARPITGLDKMEEGIAEFEHAIKQYEDAGGESYDRGIKRTWCCCTGELSEPMLWMAADQGKNSQEFSGRVITMAGRVLFGKKKPPTHAVHGVVPEPMADNDDDDDDDDDSELMAALATSESVDTPL